jgi:hypothetical protein
MPLVARGTSRGTAHEGDVSVRRDRARCSAPCFIARRADDSRVSRDARLYLIVRSPPAGCGFAAGRRPHLSRAIRRATKKRGAQRVQYEPRSSVAQPAKGATVPRDACRELRAAACPAPLAVWRDAPPRRTHASPVRRDHGAERLLPGRTTGTSPPQPALSVAVPPPTFIPSLNPVLGPSPPAADRARSSA